MRFHMTRKLQQYFCLIIGSLFLLGTVNLNAQDTTATVSVTFQVDMSQAIDSSHFDPAVHSVWVAGSMNGWDTSGTMDVMDDDNEDNVFSITLDLTPGDIEYKFVTSTVESNVLWENEENRVATVTEDVTLPVVPFRFVFRDLASVPIVEGNLLINGHFESEPGGFWYGNAYNVQTEEGNNYNFADVEVAGNPWDVNLSQNVDLIPGQYYELTFDAATSTDGTRDLIAGIGLSQEPFFAATEVITLTGEMETFTLGLYATDNATGTDFGDATSRVIFDMGADAGVVVLDNISLVTAEEEPYEPVGPDMITPLADARLLVDQDTSVYVEFVVTSPDYGYNNAQFYGQDESGGMYFFIPGDGGEVHGPAFYPGDVVQLFGHLETYSGFVEFIPDDGAMVGTAEIPDPVYLNPADVTPDSPYLGMRVVVDMVDVLSDNWPRLPITAGGGVTVSALADSEADFDLVIDRGQSYFDGHPKPYDGFTLVGNMNVFGEDTARVTIAPFFDGDIVGDFEEPLDVTIPLYFEEDMAWESVITNFDGGFASVVENPDQTGINESSNVLQLVKGAGQPWAGSIIHLTEPVLLDAGFGLSAKVWAPRDSTRMLLKLENENDGSIFVEAERVIGESNTWTEVVFDLRSVDRSFDYHNVVLIFDLGTVGDGSADYTWFVDDVEYRFGEAGDDVHLTFAVDMTDAINDGSFDPWNDVVAVTGSFNGWNTNFGSHDIMRLDYVKDNLYAADYVMFDQIIPEFYEYKYLFWDNDQGLITWENGDNRGFETTKEYGTDDHGNYITYVDTRENPAYFNTEQFYENYIKLYTGGVGGFAGEELMIPVYADILHASTSSMEFEIANFAEFGTFTGVYTDSTTLFDVYGWTMASNFVDDTLFVAAGGADNIDMNGVLFYIGVDVNADIPQGEYYLDLLWAAIDEDAPFYFEYYTEPVYINVPMLGDVSMNGDVRAYDASLVLKWLVDYIPLSNSQMINGDVTEDGELTALDASYILEYVVGLVEFPITDTPEPAGITEFGSPQLEKTATSTTIDVPVMVRDLENVKSLAGTINLGTDWYTNAEFIWSDDFSKFQREFKFANGNLKFAAAGPLTAIANGSIGTLRISVESIGMLKDQSVSIDKLRWNEAGTQQAVSNVDLDLLITSVETGALPTEFTLGQNYPNPFNPSTTINFALPQSSDVQIVVYDMLGKAVATLVNKNHTAGQHTVTFNASQLSSGIYFYQIKAGSFIETRKMTLIK
jgi:hypothetical protein